MAEYRISYSLRTIEPNYHEKNINLYQDNPTIKDIIDELIVLKPKLEKSRNIIQILSSTKIEN